MTARGEGAAIALRSGAGKGRAVSTMRNAEIAKVLSTLSDLLELKGENVFKVRAQFLAGKRWRVAEGVR